MNITEIRDALRPFPMAKKRPTLTYNLGTLDPVEDGFPGAGMTGDEVNAQIDNVIRPYLWMRILGHIIDRLGQIRENNKHY